MRCLTCRLSGILYTATHQIVQGGRFQHGKLDGEGFTNHPDGGRYAGEHRGGLREGIGKLQLANGDKYSGNFHSNLQHGRGTYTWAKGDVYDGSWSDVRMVRGSPRPSLALRVCLGAAPSDDLPQCVCFFRSSPARSRQVLVAR